MYMNDFFDNKVPVMSFQKKAEATAYLKRNRHIISSVVNIPCNKESLIMM